jgi:hypothetical protein
MRIYPDSCSEPKIVPALQREQLHNAGMGFTVSAEIIKEPVLIMGE